MEKCVIVFNGPVTDDELLRFREKFEREFLEDPDKAVALIAEWATIVPASQVVGYTRFEEAGLSNDPDNAR